MNFCCNVGHKDICGSSGHFSTLCGSVNLKIVLTIELERVLFKYKS